MNPSLSDDVVLLKLADFIASIGHFPVREELKLRATTDAHFPAATTFTRKYGPKSALASRLRDFCLTRPGYEAVVSICAPIAEQTNSELSVKPADEIGYVYLIKSGRYYKLGRTNSVGRRQYELSIQLPEKVVLVHSITTDDPAGIEAYWHRRFDAFRKNGEWFQLSVPEVNAFKRRKFM
ncbi:MAG TPA: GIY-YIG nuclease family protein [Thermoanaerobaculia bacterium]|nr:GIY-YIG nuclease family protein [Thermoanaerobaculia bacterium]